jgi:formate dehydrogenase subunit delta
MKIEALIKMANQIADFFQGEAGADAPAAVANHLRRYWEPRMRKDMLAYYDRTGGEGLEEIALKGVAILAAERPKTAESPTSSPQSPGG